MVIAEHKMAVKKNVWNKSTLAIRFSSPHCRRPNTVGRSELLGRARRTSVTTATLFDAS